MNRDLSKKNTKTKSKNQLLIDQANARTANKRRNSRATNTKQIDVTKPNAPPTLISDQQNKLDNVSTKSAILNQKNPLQNQDATVQQKKKVDQKQSNTNPNTDVPLTIGTQAKDQTQIDRTNVQPQNRNQNVNLDQLGQQKAKDQEENNDQTANILQQNRNQNVNLYQLGQQKAMLLTDPSKVNQTAANLPQENKNVRVNVSSHSGQGTGGLLKDFSQGDYVVYYDDKNKKYLAKITAKTIGSSSNNPNYTVESFMIDKNDDIIDYAKETILPSSSQVFKANEFQKKVFDQNENPNFRKGDYVKFFIPIDDEDSYERVGIITDTTDDNSYKVKVGVMLPNGYIEDIKEVFIEKAAALVWNPTYAQKMNFILKTTGTAVSLTFIVLKIRYFFLRLAGLIYNCTSDTEFVLLRTQKLVPRVDDLQKFKGQLNGLKRVIQIRDKCPQYWKKIAWAFQNRNVVVTQNAMPLDVKGFYNLFFKIPRKTINRKSESSNYTYYIAICEPDEE